MVILVHFEEDLFKCCHGDSVAQNVDFVHLCIKLFKEVLELSCLVIVDLEGYLLGDLAKLLDFAEDLLKIRLYLLVLSLVLLDHGQLVARSVTVFEEE